MRRILIPLMTIIAFVALITGLWFWSSYNEFNNAPATPITADTILFYGEECSHCKDLEKYIEENKIREKVKFDSLEVWHNKANRDVWMKKAQECNIPQENIGVPFLYSKGKCFIGTPEIENFFKKEAGI